jgi:hypothetical protein
MYSVFDDESQSWGNQTYEEVGTLFCSVAVCVYPEDSTAGAA